MSGPRDPRPAASFDEEPAVELSLEEEARWVGALRAAWSPPPLTDADHERILREALEDPLAEPSEDERGQAEALRLALERGGEQEDARLARALGHALGLGPADASAPERALEKALDEVSPRSNVIWVAFGVAASSLALAASVVLVVGSGQRGAPLPTAHAELALSRSLSPLLSADDAPLSASGRIDRIASVRARELRQNRYAKWGVR